MPESYDSAQFLGHLPGRRGPRGPIRLWPGDLIPIDEASMVANPDLADIIQHPHAALLADLERQIAVPAPGQVP